MSIYKKTYLVTGGAGFIGSNFIHYLHNTYDSAIRIINVDALTYCGNKANLTAIEDSDNYIFLNTNICNTKDIDGIFASYEIDYVVNFAAESHVDRSINDPEIFVKTNVMGTQVLLNTVKKYWGESCDLQNGKRYLQVSTDEVYGSLGDKGFFTETTPLNPKSPYSASKAGADMLVLSYFSTFKLPVVVTRCSNNYGPYQYPEKLIPLVINNCLNNKPIPVYGKGNNVRDWLYVNDHCRAIDLVLTRGTVGEIYNIGGHNEKANLDLVREIIRTVAECLGEYDPRTSYINDDLINYVVDRKGHDFRYAIDPSKISAELGWEPSISVNDGLKQTVKWYVDNQDWLEDIMRRSKSNV